ncbi:S53 family peptidase [Streptacidiphilus sp. PAMC 29251]
MALKAVPVAVASALALAALTVPAQAAPAQPQTPLTPLTGSVPSYATPSADRGPVPAAQRVTTRVYLAGRDGAGLTTLAKQLSDPNDPRHGAFLTPAQYHSRFDPSAAETREVTSWLTSAGLAVTRVTANYVETAGSAAETGAAFGTSLHEYSTGTGRQQAPDASIRVPRSLDTAVLGVTGLASAPVYAQPAGERQDTAPTPACSQYYGQHTAAGLPAGYLPSTPLAPCPYLPAQLRKAYGVSASGLTGKSVTIAVVDAYGSATMPADADRYATGHGDRAFRSGQYAEQVTPAQWGGYTACGTPASWAGEESLDIEMAHGLAPDASVRYVGANSCLDQDLMDAELSIIDARSADIVSNSWDEVVHTADGHLTPGLVAAWEQVFEQAAVEGIGMYFASGDCGDNSPQAAATGANCNHATLQAQAAFPSESPWVTSVGGSTLALRKDGGYGWETDMGDARSVLSPDATAWQSMPGSFYFGGGGGAGQDFAEPWFQAGTVPRALAGTLLSGDPAPSPRRVTPDVAMHGDLALSTLVGYSDGAPYSELGYGGTSVATPAFAGIQADAQQAAGRRLGFADPELYLRARPGLFHDVGATPTVPGPTGPGLLSDVVDLGLNPDGTRKARLYAIGQDYGLDAGSGYDAATGLGSPTTAYLDSFRRHG